MRDTGIADRLRAAGLKVVEINGWRTRGSDGFTPRGSVDHHTAAGPTGNAPSLSVVINGRAGLSGPLCNVLIGRDNTCYVVAAGRANHAGLGGWKGLSGNSSVFGVERENVGTPAEPWRPDQTFVAAACHAALIRGCARPDAELVCGHKEWAPTRKIDCHSVDYNAFRGLVSAALNPTPVAPPPTPPPPPPAVPTAGVTSALQVLALAIFSMKLEAAKSPFHQGDPRVQGVKVIQMKFAPFGVLADGAYGPVTDHWVRWFQAQHGLVQDGQVGPATANKLYP